MIGKPTHPTATNAAKQAAVLVASYTSRCTAQAVLADRGAALRAATEARECVARRKKELDYAVSLLSAHHAINL